MSTRGEDRPPPARRPDKITGTIAWRAGSSRSGRGRDRGGKNQPSNLQVRRRTTIFEAVHVPRAEVTVTVPPAAPDRLCRTLLPKSSLTSRAASSPQGCPGPSTLTANARATRARSARPATVTLSRISGPAISAPASPAARPRRIAGAGRPDVRMHARPSGSRQAGTRDRRGPSVAVRGKPTVHTDRPGGRTPSAYLHPPVTASLLRVTALRVQEFDKGRGPVGFAPIGQSCDLPV